MRSAFIKTLTELAAENPKIVLLTSDLGFSVVEYYRDRFPDRFFNVGVCEENMVGMATGLSEAGYIPFVYSITPFGVMRPYEFLKNGPAKQNLPIRVIGIGSGFDYGINGFSHYALEDIALVRTLERFNIVAPCDNTQTGNALRATWDSPASVYYRLCKDDIQLASPEFKGSFALDECHHLYEGDSLLVIAIGSAVKLAEEAVMTLRAEGGSVGLLAVSTLDGASGPILDIIRGYDNVMTVEDHKIIGGLGSFVCELLAEGGVSAGMKRFGARMDGDHRIGSRDFMRQVNGYSLDDLVENGRLLLDSEAMMASSESALSSPVLAGCPGPSGHAPG